MNPALAQPMTARRQIRLAVVASLQRAVTGVTIFTPGNWPTQQDQLPALLVKAPNARKQSKGRNLPQFDTTVSIQIEGRLKADTPEDAQDAIEALEYRVERAVLLAFWTKQISQQFPSITSDTEVSSEGKTHIAGFKMTVEVETFEDFDPTEAEPVETTWPLADPVITPLEGVNLHLDAVQPADPSGTYADPPFPDAVTPAPRTQGPDGRDEGYAEFDLPQ